MIRVVALSSSCIDRVSTRTTPSSVMSGCRPEFTTVTIPSRKAYLYGTSTLRCLRQVHLQVKSAFVSVLCCSYSIDGSTTLEYYDTLNQEVRWWCAGGGIRGLVVSWRQLTVFNLCQVTQEIMLICKGSYELWWVLRTRYASVVQAIKKFEVISPVYVVECTGGLDHRYPSIMSTILAVLCRCDWSTDDATFLPYTLERNIDSSD